MSTHWTTLYHHDELPLEGLFEDPPDYLVRYHQDAITLYISGCPQLHLFEAIFIHVVEEDCPGLVTALWNALYKDDWGHDVDYVVRYNSSIVKIKQIYQYSGMKSLNIIRHGVPEPNF